MKNRSPFASSKFRQLLDAASHSPDGLDFPDLWESEHWSTSETDDDNGNACHSSNVTPSDGLCPKDGEETHCCVQGCMKPSIAEGLCVPYDGRRCCESPNCTGSVASRGLCVNHGGARKCTQEGCDKHVASGGLCRTHGGGRRCQISECTSSAQSRGLCYVHGGGGRCQREGCGSSAKKGGFCIAHGGGHRCQVSGCTSSAVSGARCRAHGGGRRCAIEGCTSSAKTGGRCIAHGGGKRCIVSGCTSSAQRLGLCKAHGGGRRCLVEGCANSAVSRGRCIAHGGGKRCIFGGCTTTARKGGYCFAHGGRSTTSTPSTRTKVASCDSLIQSTPVSENPSSWHSTTIHSPTPALTLPPRRLLPPINTMLMANRPGILRSYTWIPPIREPIVSFGEETSIFDGSWVGTFKPDPCEPGSLDWHTTPTSSCNRSGYSWQQLQETIRRESQAQGIANEDDETAYQDKNKWRNKQQNDLLAGDSTLSI